MSVRGVIEAWVKRHWLPGSEHERLKIEGIPTYGVDANAILAYQCSKLPRELSQFEAFYLGWNDEAGRDTFAPNLPQRRLDNQLWLAYDAGVKSQQEYAGRRQYGIWVSWMTTWKSEESAHLVYWRPDDQLGIGRISKEESETLSRQKKDRKRKEQELLAVKEEQAKESARRLERERQWALERAELERVARISRENKYVGRRQPRIKSS